MDLFLPPEVYLNLQNGNIIQPPSNSSGYSNGYSTIPNPPPSIQQPPPPQVQQPPLNPNGGNSYSTNPQPPPQNNNGGNQYTGKLPENYNELAKDPSTGQTTLNGHQYIITSNNQTVDGEKVNSPKMGIKNDQVYYFDPSNSSWNLLSGSDMEKIIIESIKKMNSNIPDPTSIEALQLNQNSQLIKQISQILPDNRPVDTSQLTMQKFQPHISLFEDKFALLGLALLAGGIFMLIKEHKD